MRDINIKFRAMMDCPHSGHEGLWVYLQGIGSSQWCSENGKYYGEIKRGTESQFGGIPDKTGRDMYAGDIVEQEAIINYPGECGEGFNFLYTGEVVILPSKGVCLKRPIVIDRLEDDEKWTYGGYKNIASYRSKIIGNIHETPKLITNGGCHDITRI